MSLSILAGVRENRNFIMVRLTFHAGRDDAAYTGGRAYLGLLDVLLSEGLSFFLGQNFHLQIAPKTLLVLPYRIERGLFLARQMWCCPSKFIICLTSPQVHLEIFLNILPRISREIKIRDVI